MPEDRPWDFDQAREHCRSASRRQEDAEQSLVNAYKEAAAAEEAYRRALAEKILELRAGDLPATLCADLARGDAAVARFRRHRDIADGIREAMVQAAWRLTADRKDAQRFSDWSQRRLFAEAAGAVADPAYERPIGAAA